MLRTVLALAAAALALAAAPASAPAAVELTQSPLETSLLQELNKIRTSHGLRPLVASPALSRAADAHAVSMGRLGYFSHTSADGTSFDRRIARFYSKTLVPLVDGRREPALLVRPHLVGRGSRDVAREPGPPAQHPRASLEVDRDRRGLRPARRGSVRGRGRHAPRHRLRRPLLGRALPALRRHAYAVGMAVLIASSLRKELSGEPLFDGVSFKVERRDRLALAGPNGAGKTTLLRALIGETELHGGELAWEKGARVALHDQRPPRESSPHLREYALSGAGDLIEAEQELRRLEDAMAAGDHEPATLRRYGEAQAGSSTRAATRGAIARSRVLRGLGFADADLDRGLDTFSGGELTRASLARALAGGPDLLLLDEPTNHLDMASIEWLEQELSTIDAAVILVAHDRWFLESVSTSVLELEGGRSIFFPGQWHVWRQEKAARLLNQAKWAERQAEDIARLERFVARFRYGTKSRQAQAKLKQIERIEKVRVEAPRGGRRTLGFEFLKPARSGRMVLEAEGFDLAAGTKPLLDGRRPRARARRARGADRAERIGQDDAARGDRAGTPRPDRARREARVLLAARGRARRARERAGVRDGRDRTAAAAGAGAARAVPVLGLGRAREAGRRAVRRRAAAARAGARRGVRRELPRARRADEPSRPREPRVTRGRARGVPRHACCSSRTTVPSSTPWPSGSSRSRTARCAPTRAAGPTTCGSARARTRRLRRHPKRKSRPPKAKPAPVRAKPPPPSELQRIEASIEEREAELAELERKLAEDWGDAAAVAAHRAVRDELKGLLARWEELFDAAQA